MSLKDTLNLLLLEAEVSDQWTFDHNTTILLIIQHNLASLLKASMLVSNNFEQADQINVLGLLDGISELLEWIQNNMTGVEYTNGEE